MSLDNIHDNELFPMLQYGARYSDRLLSKCINILKSRMHFQNAIQMYEQALLYKVKEAEDLSFQFMLKNGFKVLTSKSFEKITSSSLKRLIESNDLNCSELDIFHAVVRWATANTASEGNNTPIKPVQLRAAIDHLIPYIRFPLLTSTEIADFILPTQILTSDELIEVFCNICSQNDEKPKTSFNCQPRIYQCRAEPKDGGNEEFGPKNTSNVNKLKQDVQTQTNQTLLRFSIRIKNS